VDLRRVRAEIEKIVGTGDNVMLLGEIPFTPRAKKVWNWRWKKPRTWATTTWEPNTLLVGLIREEEGVAARVMENIGVRLDVVREEVISLWAKASRAEPRVGVRPPGPAEAITDPPKNQNPKPPPWTSSAETSP
jgi:ATP-dependent Clp protease ATP-binding subunit ClpC